MDMAFSGMDKDERQASGTDFWEGQTDRQTDNLVERHTASSQAAARLIYGDTTVRLGSTTRPAQRGPTGADHLPHHIFDALSRTLAVTRTTWDSSRYYF